MTSFQPTVDRLLLQYKEYISTQEKINQLEEDYLRAPSETIKKQIAVHKKLLDQTSNEMTFANPIIWMTYKHQAYQNTPKAINTLGDLRHHCEPAGYICTARFAFLKKFVKEEQCDFSTNLSDFYNLPELKSLVENPDFMLQWQEQEYHIQNNQIAKWKK